MNTVDDPCRALDILPAREDKGPLDKVFSENLFSSLGRHACIPLVNGNYSVPKPEQLRPRVAMNQLLQPWFEKFEAFEAKSLAHRSIETRDRRYRAERLGSSVIGTNDWVSGLFQVNTPAESIAAIHLLDAILATKSLNETDADQLAMLPVVLTESGTIVTAHMKFLAFPIEGTEPSEIELVHREVFANQSAVQILRERFFIRDAGDLFGKI